MEIKKYTITQENIIKSNYQPEIDFPALANIVHIETNNGYLYLYVEQQENPELYKTQFVLFQGEGALPDIIQEKNLFHNFVIKYQGKITHIYY